MFPIRLPSLHERREDVPLLVKHFARHFAVRMGRRIKWTPASTMGALCDYSWPGNIREL